MKKIAQILKVDMLLQSHTFPLLTPANYSSHIFARKHKISGSGGGGSSVLLTKESNVDEFLPPLAWKLRVAGQLQSSSSCWLFHSASSSCQQLTEHLLIG